MITCQHAKHLFDQYLDGELSPSLQAELHAHQLSCSGCQGELALMEACGDVIAYDDCEPTVSGSFTERVLLAQRAQFKPVVHRRNWNRVLLSIASPLAAAACIGFAVLLVAPTGKEAQPGKVLSSHVSVSQGVKSILNLNGDARVDSSLPVQEMPAGFMDAILEPFVKQTKTTVDSTKRSIEQLDSLIRLGFAGANDALAASSRTPAADRGPTMNVQPKAAEPNPLDPSFLRQSPLTPEPTSEVDDTIEAL